MQPIDTPVRGPLLSLLAVLVLVGTAGAVSPDLALPNSAYPALHAGGCAMLAFLGGLLWRPLMLVAIAVLIFGIALEGLQSLSPDRTSSLFDIGYNALGASIGAATAAIAGRRWRGNPPAIARSVPARRLISAGDA